METWRSIMATLEKDSFLASIDLTRLICISPSSLATGSFYTSYRSKHYQFRAIPFEFTAASRRFTKVLVTLVASLRQQGVTVFSYLDDLLISAPSIRTTHRDLHLTMATLCQHGFIINRQRPNTHAEAGASGLPSGYQGFQTDCH